MVNILLNGCNGKMGKALAQYIKGSRSFNLLYSIDKDNIDLFNNITKKPDVIIDFSSTQATFLALDYAVKNLVPIVIATTGFSKEEENKIKEYSEAIPIFKSSNMSYCIHIFSNLVANLATKLNNVDIEIIEKHHRNKVDAPSGTALMIADNINKCCNGKYEYVFNRCTTNLKNDNNNDNIDTNTNTNTNISIKTNMHNVNNSPVTSSQGKKLNGLKNFHSEAKSYNEIGFSSIRGGKLVGEHTVLFIGENESFELTHTAYSRSIYVEGALKASQFIITKKNGLYSMADM